MACAYVGSNPTPSTRKSHESLYSLTKQSSRSGQPAGQPNAMRDAEARPGMWPGNSTTLWSMVLRGRVLTRRHRGAALRGFAVQGDAQKQVLRLAHRGHTPPWSAKANDPRFCRDRCRQTWLVRHGQSSGGRSPARGRTRTVGAGVCPAGDPVVLVRRLTWFHPPYDNENHGPARIQDQPKVVATHSANTGTIRIKDVPAKRGLFATATIEIRSSTSAGWCADRSEQDAGTRLPCGDEPGALAGQPRPKAGRSGDNTDRT